MEEQSPESVRTLPPNSSALAHARRLSVVTGTLAGGVAGFIFGGLWSIFGRPPRSRTMATASLVGAGAGALISAATWHAPMVTQDESKQPIANPDFLKPEHATPHTAKIEAERQAEPGQVTRQ
jgi:hypothetical protein